jgi:N-acetylglutamate synthase-like GNAT family acetyltransferase
MDQSSTKYQQVWDLREAILRTPLGMSLKNEDLSRDNINTFFVAEQGDKVVGCVLMEPKDPETVQLRAMAVYNEHQGHGIGRLLVQALEQHAAESGYKKIILHARKVVLGFYKSMNYQQVGGEFVEVGIPHYHMEKIV